LGRLELPKNPAILVQEKFCSHLVKYELKMLKIVLNGCRPLATRADKNPT
jgi:hypothetical protein